MEQSPPPPPTRPQQTPGQAPPPPPPGYMPMSMYPPMQKQSSSMSVVRKVFTGLLASFLMFSIFLNLYLGAFFASSMAGPTEATLSGTNQKSRIVVIPIDGAIDSLTAAQVGKSLRALKNNPPQALILRINSPGGGVSASDQIWNAVMQFKTQTKIPVVASFGGVAASGGYYIASAADYIVAEPTCITGSIGVIAQAFTLDGLMTKIGVTPETIVSTDSFKKDTLNTFRPWEDTDRKELRDILDHAYERFIKIVDDGRPELELEQVRKLATGEPYTTAQALLNKLVDAQGYLDTAIQQAIKLAGLPASSDPKITVIQEQNPFRFLGPLGQQSQSDITSLFSSDKIRGLASELAVPRLEYRMELK